MATPHQSKPPPPLDLFMATVSSKIDTFPDFGQVFRNDNLDQIDKDFTVVGQGSFHNSASSLLGEIEWWPQPLETHFPNIYPQQNNAFLVIIHNDLLDMTAFQLLQHIQEKWPHINVAIVQSNHDVSMSLACMEAGAIYYISEPITLEKVEALRDRVIRSERMKRIEYFIQNKDGRRRGNGASGGGVYSRL